jgi:hypothetical protein
MFNESVVRKVRVWIMISVAGITSPSEVLAYVDPGTTGLLSQILYVLFYGALGIFFYCLRYIKQYLLYTKEYIAKLIRRDS